MSGPFAEPPPRRRLSIAHLMLWTLGCALALGFYRSIELEQQRPDDRFSLILQYFGLPYCIPAGARVGAVFLFGWMTWRGDKSFPTQPGHWLLLIEGTSILLTWLGQAVAFLAVGDQARNISYSSAAEVPSCIVSAILYAVALQKLSGESRLWKATLWLLLLEYIFAAFVLGATALSILSASDFLSLWKVEYTCSPAILLGGLPIVAFGDPRRRQTDFLHWTGVAAMVATALLSLVFRWVVF